VWFFLAFAWLGENPMDENPMDETVGPPAVFFICASINALAYWSILQLIKELRKCVPGL